MPKGNNNNKRPKGRHRQTYSNAATRLDIFRGNLTISADISHIKTFNTERFCVDLAAAEPRAWKHVRGAQAVDAKFVELCFDNRDALQHILTKGLDTHRQHWTFTPDEPLVTTVSFWNIPIQLDKATVDEHIQRFGTIKSSYRAKKNVCGNLIYTGIHVYTITLKRAIPKIIQMGGRRVRTKYTVQDRHLQMEKEDKEKKTQERETERRTNDAHTEITETPLNTGVDEVDAAPAGPVAEEAATTEIVEEEEMMSKESFCEAMETAIGFVHKDDAPFEQAGSKQKKKGKNGKDERQVKRSLARRFKIDMDILELTVQNQMVDRLPAEAFDDGQFTRGMLYGLFYFMEGGDVHDQEWYVKDSPPPSDQWNPEGYVAWLALSYLTPLDIKRFISQWEKRFEAYYLYI